jgi:hypothetical protein
VEVFRPAQGILQLNIPISGTIHNPHNLKNFPFDEDIIEFTFVGDMLRDGRKADASDFRLIPIGEMPEPNHLGLTVPFLASYKDSVDSMPEFGIIGAVISASTKSKKQMKKKYSYVEFGVVIRRSFGYYFWKVVFMLWMVTALTFSIFGHDAVSVSLYMTVVFLVDDDCVIVVLSECVMASRCIYTLFQLSRFTCNFFVMFRCLPPPHSVITQIELVFL